MAGTKTAGAERAIQEPHKFEVSAAALRAARFMFNDKTVIGAEREAPGNEIPSSALTELSAAGIIGMRGFAKGKYARVKAFVKLLKPLDHLREKSKGHAAVDGSNGAVPGVTRARRNTAEPLTLQAIIYVTEALEEKVRAEEARITAKLRADLDEATKAFTNDVAMGVGDTQLQKDMQKVVQARQELQNASKAVLLSALREIHNEGKYNTAVVSALLRVAQGKE